VGKPATTKTLNGSVPRSRCVGRRNSAIDGRSTGVAGTRHPSRRGHRAQPHGARDGSGRPHQESC
jgi:hypothetical protein